MPSTMTTRDWGALGVLSLLWGGSFFFYKVVAHDVPPLVTVASRVAIAGPLLFALVRASGQTMPRSASTWSAFVCMGVLNNVIPFGLIAWSETQITSGLASILIATAPIFTVLLARAVGERLTFNRVLGVLCGLAGVAVLVGPNSLGRLDLTSAAQLALLAAAMSYAAAAIFGRRFARMSLPPLVTATGQLLGASLVALPLAGALEFMQSRALERAPGLERPGLHWTAFHLPLEIWLALLGLALLSTALAYLIYFQILATAGATNVLLVTLLVPISALALGALFLHEHLEWTSYAGMTFIFAALAIIDGRALPFVLRAFARVRSQVRQLAQRVIERAY